MIGPRYWTTGITVSCRAPYLNHKRAWGGKLRFLDDGFSDDSSANKRISTEGTLETRYMVEDDERGGDGDDAYALTVILDVLIEDATQLGIEFQGKTIYVATGKPGEGEWDPPDNWRELLASQCKRLGWDEIFGNRRLSLYGNSGTE